MKACPEVGSASSQLLASFFRLWPSDLSPGPDNSALTLPGGDTLSLAQLLEGGLSSTLAVAMRQDSRSQCWATPGGAEAREAELCPLPTVSCVLDLSIPSIQEIHLIPPNTGSFPHLSSLLSTWNCSPSFSGHIIHLMNESGGVHLAPQGRMRRKEESRKHSLRFKIAETGSSMNFLFLAHT